MVAVTQEGFRAPVDKTRHHLGLSPVAPRNQGKALQPPSSAGQRSSSSCADRCSRQEEEAESSPGRGGPWLCTAHSPGCGCDRIPAATSLQPTPPASSPPTLVPPAPRRRDPPSLPSTSVPISPNTQLLLSHCLMLTVTSPPLPLHRARPPQSLLHSETNGGKSLLAAGAHTVTVTELGWGPKPPPHTGSAAATCALDRDLRPGCAQTLRPLQGPCRFGAPPLGPQIEPGA